ncbi:recombinase RecT [Azospirillum canadense]|uniref:recombinase RecT n=1 Tax=Azospirillum canadense TaxID=403962 RepID=UPI002225EEFA|nr:recombinase RecT [Azospirillum canadense]MCW2243613.1 recombination protein RecT [Azospirillum canadense]
MSTNTGTAVAQRDPVKELQADLSKEAVKAQFSVALPSHITPDKFARVVMTAAAKNPDLAQADRRSLFNSCLEAAADGLMPNGKEAALVIFNTKEKQGGREVWIKKVQYMPMVRGLRKLAMNSGQIKRLDAYVVHKNDEFDYQLGFEANIHHKPPTLDMDRGPAIGAYSIAITDDDEKHVEVMSFKEIEKVRSVSRSKDSGPWKDWWGEMARKTVLRRLMKSLPLSEELERVIERDDAMHAADERRQAGPSISAVNSAQQLASFSIAPALEHEVSDAGGTWEPPQQTYALVTLDGEVKEFTSSAEWLARFEAALQGAADPAKLWELNSDAAEWAADMTEGGDDTLARLRQAYLPKPEVEQGKPEQAGQPDATSAAQGDTAAPAGDEWADEAAELQRIGSTCQTFGQWTAFLDDHADRITAVIAANGGTHAAAWREFAQGRTASFQAKGKK